MALKGILMQKPTVRNIGIYLPITTAGAVCSTFVEQTDKSKLFDEMEVAA